ncbi:unnamed protein product [Porites lobata]|uniref:Uncharacterized protein n=1 Tax=Porites lobata TaxID=104759 RepID=A0ABN8QYJ5_9CNID|nr:unnamed protein product [Porites lobata]
MAQSRFATVTSDEISKINEEAIPDNTKKATKFGLALNKCLQKFYLSARKRDGSYYNKKSLIAIRAALDRHLKSPPFSKPFSIVGDSHFNEANKSLSNFLKTLSKSGQIK